MGKYKDIYIEMEETIFASKEDFQEWYNHYELMIPVDIKTTITIKDSNGYRLVFNTPQEALDANIP